MFTIRSRAKARTNKIQANGLPLDLRIGSSSCYMLAKSTKPPDQLNVDQSKSSYLQSRTAIILSVHGCSRFRTLVARFCWTGDGLRTPPDLYTS